MEIEALKEIQARLGNSGAASQVKAVMASIKLINQTEGMLDAGNRATALYHLSVALSGKDRAVSTLVDTANWLQYAE
jgi:hypothetical protein